jgi:hypothetical protein
VCSVVGPALLINASLDAAGAPHPGLEQQHASLARTWRLRRGPCLALAKSDRGLPVPVLCLGHAART